MKSHVQVLGAGSRECGSHSLYYFLDQHRILFNASEGLQRLATQCKIKISPRKLSAVFISRLDWECFGGLPGLILTMGDTARLCEQEDVKSPVLRLIGPKHLKHAIAAMRPFLHRRDFAVEVDELCCGPDEISHWRDARADVDVWALEIATQTLNASECEETVQDLNVANLECDQLTDPHSFLLKMFQSEASVQLSTQDRENRREEYSGRLPINLKVQGERALAFVVDGPTQPGKFDKAAALALGVPPGPLFGQLTRGQPVTLANGSIVDPESCVGPIRPSPSFLLLDVPSRAMALASFARLDKLRELGSRSGTLSIAIHLLGEEVVSDPILMREYMGFCAALGVEGRHLLTGPNNAILMTSSMALQRSLQSALKSSYFPSGSQNPGFPQFPVDAASCLLRPLDRIHLNSEAPKVQIENRMDWHSEIENDTAVSCFDGSKEIFISTLGTGSAIPGKYRNVSSSILECHESGELIFLDCGEMTLGQVYRLFGLEGARTLMKRTAAILISHLHGDHHLGVISLIQSITRLRPSQQLLLIAPERFKVWLEEFSQVSDFGLSRVDFVACNDVRTDGWILPGSQTEIKSFDVDHCYDAFGFQIYCSGRKIVYSGDTRPCESLILAAQGADLLINEATMENDLIHEAVLRKHCTIQEAIDVGVEAGVNATVLTHFSQRYAKGALSFDFQRYPRVVMGVDLLRFPLSDFHTVSAYSAILPTLLPVDDNEDATEDEETVEVEPCKSIRT